MAELDPATFRPETRALHAGQKPDPATQRARRPDLRHHQLRLRRRRARGPTLRPRGVRQHLHPDHEPDDGRLRGAGRRARGRRRGPRARVGPGRRDAVDPQPRPGRRQHRRRRRRSTAGRTTCSPTRCRRSGSRRRYVDGSDPSAFGRAINEKTKAVFLELIGNPRLDVHDLASIADVAHARGVPVIVDNTFAPLLAQPIKHGADIVIHSATKWIGGHGTAIGGVVVDGGTFDWAASERFKQDFVDPDPSYHGISYTKAFGNLAFILKLRVQGLRDVGAALSPFNAFLFLQGLETLPLRITRHSENALAVARWLETPARGDLGQLPGPRVASVAQAGQALPDGRLRRHRHLRRQGRRRGRPAADRQRPDLQPAGQRRRRQVADHPSGLDHALAARARRSRSRPASRRT